MIKAYFVHYCPRFGSDRPMFLKVSDSNFLIKVRFSASSLLEIVSIIIQR